MSANVNKKISYRTKILPKLHFFTKYPFFIEQVCIIFAKYFNLNYNI